MEYLLVEPEFPINLGAIARALMNFGVKKIHMVNPQVDLNEKEIKMFSKKAYSLIKNAKIYNSMEEAVVKIKPDLTIGTSGVRGRFRRGIMRKMISLKKVGEKLNRQGKILVVFGREGTGLNEKESALCNYFVTIPTAEEYPVMNLSHSVAVVAYELEQIKSGKQDIGDIENTCRMFNSFLDTLSLMTQIRKGDKIKQAFRNVISRGEPTEIEANCIVASFHRAEKVLGKGLKKAVRKR